MNKIVGRLTIGCVLAYCSTSNIHAHTASAPVYDLQYDGLTTSLLTAPKSISANVTYHVKIAIADYSDAQLDSAVFIKTQSFTCP